MNSHYNNSENGGDDMAKLHAGYWKILVATYFLLLSVVLILPNPWGLFGEQKAPSTNWHWSIRWLKNDKVQHCLAYGLGAGLLLRVGLGWGLVFWVVALHGGIVEIAQHWFPPRTTDLLDWCADLVGGLAASLVRYRLPGRGP
jgi:VanZ family protein